LWRLCILSLNGNIIVKRYIIAAERTHFTPNKSRTLVILVELRVQLRTSAAINSDEYDPFVVLRGPEESICAQPGLACKLFRVCSKALQSCLWKASCHTSSIEPRDQHCIDETVLVLLDTTLEDFISKAERQQSHWILGN
jgi:hypothetical protein